MDFKTRIDLAADRIAAQADLWMAAIQKEKRMAGGKFFALLDEESQSDQRLDDLAEGLMARRQALEARAKKAIETKQDQLGAAEYYLDRLEGKIKELEDSATNGGPTLGASAPSPQPLPSAAAPLPQAPQIKVPPRQMLVDYENTNGLGHRAKL